VQVQINQTTSRLQPRRSRGSIGAVEHERPLRHLDTYPRKAWIAVTFKHMFDWYWNVRFHLLPRWLQYTETRLNVRLEYF